MWQNITDTCTFISLFFYWIKDELAFGLDFSYKLLIFKKKLKIQKTFQQENDQNVEGPKTLHIGEF